MARGKRKVLVVDDEASVLEPLVAIFEEAGFDVATATNALDAHIVLEDSGPVDLVVTDIRMPGRVDGLVFGQVVAEAHPRIPIIIISGQSEPDDRDVPAGATFVAKPFRPSHLLEEAKHLLARAG